MKKYLKQISLRQLIPLTFILILVILLEILSLTGFIPAKSYNKPTAGQLNTDSCQNFKTSSKLSCWEDLIDQTLNQQGLEQAFEVVDTLFKAEPSFASGCHEYVHKLGEKAYFLFSENKDFKVSTKSSYCGYGFYHGFMEILLQKTKDMDEARKFCQYADEQLKKQTSDAGGACYHGIGHGTVDGSDPRAWGDPQAMIQPALDLCESVSNDENPPPRYGKLFRCTSGAFNGLEILMDSSQYKLSPDKKDPFSICRNQPARYKQSLKTGVYKEACYTQFVVSVMAVTDHNFEKSATIINTIPEDEYAVPTLRSLAIELTHREKVNYEDVVKYCQGLQNRFQIPCITAIGEGFLKYGPPQAEYVKAIDFCNSALLNEKERLNCFNKVLSLLRIWYTKEKSSQICESVDSKYRWNGCQYN